MRYSLRENNIKGSGEALGEALKTNSSLKGLDLGFCSLGPEDGKGLAGGMLVNASLTEARCLRCAPLKLPPSQSHLSAQVDLRGNNFGEVGWCTIFDTLRDSPQNKIAKWHLHDQGINPTIVKSLAAYMAVSASLTSVSLARNRLCGHCKENSWDREYKGTYDVSGIKAIADALHVNSSMNKLNVLSNSIGDEGYEILTKVAEEKGIFTFVGFDEGQTEADLSKKRLGPIDAKLIARELATGFVSTSLNSLE